MLVISVRFSAKKFSFLTCSITDTTNGGGFMDSSQQEPNKEVSNSLKQLYAHKVPSFSYPESKKRKKPYSFSSRTNSGLG